MEMKQQIFYDLDGTIVDNKKRHYYVYKQVLQFMKKEVLSYDKWLSELHMANKMPFVGNKNEDDMYKGLYNQILEKPSLLKMDTLIPGMKEVVLESMKHYDVYIVTYRKDARLTQGQVRRVLGVKIPIIAGLPEPFSLEALRDMKSGMIRDKVPEPDGFIIGDTEFEILAGKDLGIKTISVLWGSRRIVTLCEYKPDHIVMTPKEILKVIL